MFDRVLSLALRSYSVAPMGRNVSLVSTYTLLVFMLTLQSKCRKSSASVLHDAGRFLSALGSLSCAQDTPELRAPGVWSCAQEHRRIFTATFLTFPVPIPRIQLVVSLAIIAANLIALVEWTANQYACARPLLDHQELWNLEVNTKIEI